MDYKRIIKSRKIRIKLLNLLSFVPDKLMIQWQYRLKMGRKLNLKNPKRYTEKIQWLKLYYKNPRLIQCVDKYDVRQYVADCGYENILNECYGCYSVPQEIDFDKLPNQFVLKDTLGGGGTAICIINDKNNMVEEDVIKMMNEWVSSPYNVRGGGREWPYYSGKKHRIIVEKYLPAGEHGLIDYKFMCFDGTVRFCYVLMDRIHGVSVKEAICDRELNVLDYQEVGDDKPEFVEKPIHYDKMLDIAEHLSQGFPHVRVDLYNVDGEIIFGELTFFDSSGYGKFEPDEFDYILGECLCISKY